MLDLMDKWTDKLDWHVKVVCFETLRVSLLNGL
jgi:hypothetical protein